MDLKTMTVNRIMVIGPKSKVTLELAESLSKAYKLPVMTDHTFTELSWKNRPDGVYVSHTMLYQQVKKLRFDIIAIAYDSFFQTVSKPGVKKYKLVKEDGSTYITTNGAIMENLSKTTALSIQHKMAIKRINLTIEPYEAE